MREVVGVDPPGRDAAGAVRLTKPVSREVKPAVSPTGLLDLQRQAGNSAVDQLLAGRAADTGVDAVVQRQPKSPAPAPPAPSGADLSMKFQQQVGASPPDYNAAALTLNAMSDPDMEAELRVLAPAVQTQLFLGALRTMLMWPPPHRVTDVIHRLSMAVSKEGLVTFFRESIAASKWHEAAVTLNGLSDSDIVATLTTPATTTPQLVGIRDAAQLHMAGWNTRVLTPVRAMLQGATATEMAGMVGSRATWVPSGPGSGNTFEAWASAPTQGTTPPVQPSTTINCWEMVLLAAFRAGTINWKWIHDAYVATGVGRWSTFLTTRLLPTSRQTYNRGSPASPTPRRGDIVLWNGANHVGMAVGGRDGAGRVQVYSFWPPPGQPSIARTEDAVKITTIEELADYMNAEWGGPTLVEFGPGPW